MPGLLPSLRFLITVWLSAWAGMKLVPAIVAGYAVWAAGALILYFLRNTPGVQ
jgi:hypothetical protein